MNDMQAEHGDHDDLDEGTDNDHHSDGDNGNGGGERVHEGTNNDGDDGEGANNDGYEGEGGGERVRAGANNDGSEGGGDGDGGDGGDGERTNNDHNGGGGEGPIGYADAMSELEHILRDLEGNDLDVDMLASRVERASLLIGLCRTRIGAARVQVERVVANLDSDDDKYGIEAGSEAGN